MKVRFVNPVGHINEADLTSDQIKELEKRGYTILDKPKKPRIHVSESACVACE